MSEYKELDKKVERMTKERALEIFKSINEPYDVIDKLIAVDKVIDLSITKGLTAKDFLEVLKWLYRAMPWRKYE